MEQSEYRRTHYGWNVFHLGAVEASWGIGMALTAPAVILSVFLAGMGAPKVLIGCLGLVWGLCQPLPQLLSGYFTGHLGRQKWAVALGHAIPATAWLILAICLFAMGGASRAVTIGVFFLCFALFAIAYEFTIPLWGSFVGNVLPSGRKALGFGAIFSVSALFGAVGAEAARRILKSGLPFTWAYGCCFLLASIVCGLGALFFLPVREPPQAKPERRGHIGSYIRTLFARTIRNRDLRNFMLGDMLCIGGVIVAQFYGVYACDRLGMDRSDVAGLARITLIAQAVSCILLGWAGDRVGFKRVIVFGRSMMFSSAILLWAGGGPGTVRFVAAATGIAMAALNVTWINLIMKLARSTRHASTLGAVSVIQAPAIALFPLIGGKLIDTMSYAAAFGLAAVLTGTGIFVLIFFVREHATPAAERGGTLAVATAKE